ncbi:hypothetical protein KHM83_07585 [Fusibacter paucivorans]|uniref:MerR HTH family regulatory protein n=1 Tax=Fusibacter paucivorans TaxID=76009 RepID=A0ABS5PQ85_9FIRM|nr:hypothetical protein [Fusibacter paucivorans]MBS7526536.1 hypothetical protein [Fusibacter paucivorans]
MYKISEAAELIGVEKVDIFEKMITHKAILDPNIKKIEGVTYFEERGIAILKTLFFGTQSGEEKLTEEGAETIAPEKRVVKVRSKFERERDILYDKILILKHELVNLDDELSMKDDMLLSYQKKLIEDLDAISKLQTALSKKV